MSRGVMMGCFHKARPVEVIEQSTSTATDDILE